MTNQKIYCVFPFLSNVLMNTFKRQCLPKVPATLRLIKVYSIDKKINWWIIFGCLTSTSEQFIHVQDEKKNTTGPVKEACGKLKFILPLEKEG